MEDICWIKAGSDSGRCGRMYMGERAEVTRWLAPPGVGQDRSGPKDLNLLILSPISPSIPRTPPHFCRT